MKSFLKYNLASFVWALVILWLSLTSGSNLPKVELPNIDKLLHFLFYFILAVLMFYGWVKQQSFPVLHAHTFVPILLLVIAYGVVIELMQGSFTSNRHFEVLDVLANATGALTGSSLSVKLFK